MFPIALDLTKIPVLLIGSGDLLARRKKQLDEAGALRVVSGQWSVVSEEEWKAAAVVMVAGLSYDEAKSIADKARAAGKLVNVEDVNELCDFYFTANIRRGDLLIAVSTGGASPTLARKVRDKIGQLFGDEWAARTKEIADFRTGLKNAGKTMREVLSASENFLAEKGWLK